MKNLKKDLKTFSNTFPYSKHSTSDGSSSIVGADFLIAKAIEASYKTSLCVCTYLFNPSKPFMDLWYSVNKKFEEYKLHLVPFEDDHNGILSVIESLGEKFDFLIDVCDSLWYFVFS